MSDWVPANNLSEWQSALLSHGGDLPVRVRLQMMAAGHTGDGRTGKGVLLNPELVAKRLDGGKGMSARSIEENFKRYGVKGTWFIQTDPVRYDGQGRRLCARYGLQVPVAYRIAAGRGPDHSSGQTWAQRFGHLDTEPTLNSVPVGTQSVGTQSVGTLPGAGISGSWIDESDLKKITDAHSWTEEWARRCVMEIVRGAKGSIYSLPDYVAAAVARNPLRFKPTHQPPAFPDLPHQRGREARETTEADASIIPAAAERGIQLQQVRDYHRNPAKRAAIKDARSAIRKAAHAS